MLKLALPLKGKDHKFTGQVACGIADLPEDGTEAVAQKWLAVTDKKTKQMLTCINDGVYGAEFKNAQLKLTLLRSPAYSCHPFDDRIIMDKDRFIPRSDQGERIYRFWLNAGPASSVKKQIDRRALVKNETPFALSFFPPGTGKKPKPIAILSDDTVQITAVKKAHKGNDIIIRLFEPTGRKRSTVLSLPALKKRLKIEMKSFEIKTLRIKRATGKIAEVDLLEKPLTKPAR